jgi:periplasmic copper chaperone A
MKLSSWSRGLSLAAVSMLSVAALAFAACGDDDDNTAPSPTPGGNGGESETVVATVGDLEIVSPLLRFTLGNTAATYFTIRNSGLEDRLVEARSDLNAMVQLHEVVTEGGSGVMQEIEGGIVVPANGEVILQQGGLHVMLMKIDPELQPEQEVELTLVFENAGEVTFTLPATQLTSTGGDDGMGHSHDDDDHDDDGHSHDDDDEPTSSSGS